MDGGQGDGVGPARLAGLQAELLRFCRGQVGEERAERGLLLVVCEGGRRVRERVQVGAGDGGIPPRLGRHLDIQAQCPLHLPDQVGQRPADMRAQRPQFGGERGEAPVGLRRVGTAAAQVVQRLHEAAGQGGQIRDRLRQRVVFMRYAAAPSPGFRRRTAAVAGLEIRCTVPGLAAFRLPPAGAVLAMTVPAGAG